MCCCKTHLHAIWTIKAILANIQKQRDLQLKRRRKEQEENRKRGIVVEHVYDEFSQIPFVDDRSFYALLAEECGTDDSTYISWDCTQSKKHLCNHAEIKWKDIKTMLLDDNVTTAPLHHFEKIETTNGNNVMRYGVNTWMRIVMML